MQLTELSCGAGRPPGCIFLRSMPNHMICRVLVIESGSDLTLIDTGFGLRDVDVPQRLGWARLGLGLKLRAGDCARSQLEAGGRDPERVRDIVLTHLDLDHAGGVEDFPDSRVHVSSREAEAAQTRRSLGERLRYRPQQLTPDRWQLYSPENSEENWFGFASQRITTQSSDLDLRLVSLPGHTRGHCGVALRSDEQHWLLHVGDSYYSRTELDPGSDSWALRRFRASIDFDPQHARNTLSKLRELEENSEVSLIGSHDPRESLPERFKRSGS